MTAGGWSCSDRVRGPGGILALTADRTDCGLTVVQTVLGYPFATWRMARVACSTAWRMGSVLTRA